MQKTQPSLRSPLKRIGGKCYSAEKIVAAFPPSSSYNLYCEPCCGALHVLMNKPSCKQHTEVVNDLDDNLIIFWQQMLANGQAIAERMDQLPYSRKIYYDYYRSLFDGTELSDFERACRYFYSLRGTGTGWLRRSPVGWNHEGKAVHAFRSAIEVFEAVQERLHNVIIDNRDVRASIKRYDAPLTLFYVDPPYFGVEQYYEASRYDGFPHAEMAEILNACEGKVALSYYPHPDLEHLYPAPKWRHVTWEQPKSSDIKSETPATATEQLLMNYLPTVPTTQTPSLWEVQA